VAIVVKLKGGLGNQMFQYALGRTLSLKNNTRLWLDSSFLDEGDQQHTYRQYSLHFFNVKGKLKKVDLNNNSLPILQKILFKFHFKKKIKYICEGSFNFNEEILNVSDNTYLDGYWQSFKYFESYWSMIKNDFEFALESVSINNSILKKIKSANSISVHVRRGDYVTNGEANLYHGVLSQDYYHKAEKEIAKHVSDPTYFIFSDDIDWAKNNIRFNSEQYYVSNSHAAHEDLYMMSKCRHAIIANSSFSWWGAWLIENLDKVIVAPVKWFKDSSFNTSDLCPAYWKRI
jgi:hypothetical protein